MFTRSRQPRILIALLALILLYGCSLRRIAINKIGDALASGSSTYETDDDLELVGDALPFGLKLIESLLQESPEHLGLLRTACQGFTTYAYIYVQQVAEMVAERDLQRSRRMRARARRLYLRAHAHGLRGLEVDYPGIGSSLRTAPQGALDDARPADVPLLYWNAAALGLAVSVSKGQARMLARLPEVEALLDRALELEESWNDGALHEFRIVLAGAKPGATDFARIERHYQRALELSGGARASLHVAYAEVVSVRRQNHDQFRSLLEEALAIDPDAHREIRLSNLVAQRRARWLLSRVDDLILTGAGHPAADPG